MVRVFHAHLAVTTCSGSASPFTGQRLLPHRTDIHSTGRYACSATSTAITARSAVCAASIVSP